MNNRLFENYYKSDKLEDMISDMKEINDNYVEKSKGPNKMNVFVDFLIENEKSVMNCLGKTLTYDLLFIYVVLKKRATFYIKK